MTDNILRVFESWFQRRRDPLADLGVVATLTWGPRDRTPRAGFIDFESPLASARFVLWSNGDADVGIVDTLENREELSEYREITSEIGLEDIEKTVLDFLLPGRQ